MHPRTDELLRHLTEHRAGLQAAVDATPTAVRERKPSAARWSIAEVIEHLAIVERQVGVLLERGLRAARAAGSLPPAADRERVTGSLDDAELLNRERRFQASDRAQPTGELTAADAWRALEESRRALRTVVESADGLATASIRAPHPFLGELTFDQWIEFVGLHEARHAAQIREIAVALA